MNLLSCSLLQRSAEFRLPEISLSSLETLLQTVTQKLVSKRRSSDEGPWRRIQSDHLLDAVNERRLREKMVEEQIDFCTTGEKLNNMYVHTCMYASWVWVNFYIFRYMLFSLYLCYSTKGECGQYNIRVMFMLQPNEY